MSRKLRIFAEEAAETIFFFCQVDIVIFKENITSKDIYIQVIRGGNCNGRVNNGTSYPCTAAVYNTKHFLSRKRCR